MSDLTRMIAQALTGAEIETSWRDILTELDNSVEPEPAETAEEVKSRLLAKLNERKGT